MRRSDLVSEFEFASVNMLTGASRGISSNIDAGALDTGELIVGVTSFGGRGGGESKDRSYRSPSC